MGVTFQRVQWLALGLIMFFSAAAGLAREPIARAQAVDLATTNVVSRPFVVGIGPKFQDFRTTGVVSRAFVVGVGPQYGPQEVRRVVSRQFAVLIATPDLRPTQVAGPAAAEAGEDIVVSWTVENAGEVDAIGSWTDALWLVQEGEPYAGLPLADLEHGGGLPSSASYETSATVTIPGNIRTQNYELIVYTNYAGDLFEADFSNNTGRSPALALSQTPQPNLQVTSVATPEDGFAFQPLTVTWEVQNTGEVAATAPWVDRVLAVPASGPAVTLAEVERSGDLIPGAAYAQQATVQYPAMADVYTIAVDTDARNAVPEGIEGGEQDNRGVSAGSFAVDSYLVTASTDTEEGLSPFAVLIEGSATRTDTGDPVPNAAVAVGVTLRGTTRILEATTDASGDYAVTFQSLQNEAGSYGLSAGPPGALSGTQDTFVLYGMRSGDDNPDVVSVFDDGQDITQEFTFVNNGNTTLTGLAANLVLPAGVQGEAKLSASELPPLGSAAVTVTLRGGDGPARLVRTAAAAEVSISSDQGASARFPFETDLRTAAPSLSASPSGLSITVVRGTETTSSQEFHTFILRNEGSAQARDIVVRTPPGEDWISVTSARFIRSMQPDQAIRLNLRIAPGTEVPFGLFQGTIFLDGENASLSIPLTIRVQSDARGDLLVNATDEFSYWDEENNYPKVEGAQVRVFDGLVPSQLVSSTTTDASGEALFEALPEGYYIVETDSPDHQPTRQSIFVEGGQVTDLEAFMSRQLVTYEWNVRPVSYGDRYEIDVRAVFETFVPAPVLTIDPPRVDLADIRGGSQQINFTITNHGLIRADDLRFSFRNTADWRITPLVEVIGDLPAQSTVVVPVLFEDVGAGGATRSAALNQGGCASPALSLGWSLLCGTRQNYGTGIGLDNGSAGGDGCGGGIPGGGGAGGAWGTPTRVGTVGNCDPCINDLLLAGTICALGALPGPPGCLVGAGSCGFDLGSAGDGRSAALAIGGCAASALGCFGGPAGSAAGTAICFLLATDKCGLLGPFKAGEPQRNSSLSSARRYFIEQIDRLRAVSQPLRVVVGDDRWFDECDPDDADLLFEILATWQAAIGEETEEGLSLGPQEQVTMAGLLLPRHLDLSDLLAFVERWNRTIAYYDEGILELTDIPDDRSTDFVTVSAFAGAVEQWEEAEMAAAAEGFNSAYDAALAGAEALVDQADNQPAGICARVEIKISQEAVLSRDAFEAELLMANSGNDPLQQLQVSLYALDADGNQATERFAILDPELAGIGAVNGTADLASGKNFNAVWTLLPRDEAAINGEVTPYRIGGEVSYTLNGQLIELPLLPVEIDVYPNPALELDYFLVRQVYGDDPFTSGTEPAEPFDLGVLVRNAGPGIARDLTIVSSQPEIVENEKGLLVDFRILESQVGTEEIEPSLTVDFGTLAAGGAQTARWRMVSSLQGEFIDYAATFRHVTGLGDEELSLIDSVEIHPLIRSVRATVPSDDGAFDFLADDVADLEDLPDRLYESTGNEAPVTSRLDASALGKPTPSNLVIEVSLPTPPAGYVYFRLDDPGQSRYAVSRVTRLADDAEIPMPHNAWQTNRIIRLQGQAPRPEQLLHVFDYVPEDLAGRTLRYQVEYTALGDAWEIF